MSDLADFLLARIAEDEAGASNVHEMDCDLVRQGVVDPTFGWTCSCGHPARVLAECVAKRAILARWDDVDDMATVLREAKVDGSVPVDQAAALTPLVGVIDGLLREERDALLRLLGLPYANHPDYREEWRP